MDEIQRRPELFPALRPLLDRPGAPIRFLLLGSASFRLVRGASESLAGRIGFCDLTGFGLDETAEGADWRTLWERGGFPRSFLQPDLPSSVRWRDDFVRTFFERDLSALGIRVPPEALRRFVSHDRPLPLTGLERARVRSRDRPWRGGGPSPSRSAGRRLHRPRAAVLVRESEETPGPRAKDLRPGLGPPPRAPRHPVAPHAQRPSEDRRLLRGLRHRTDPCCALGPRGLCLGHPRRGRTRSAGVPQRPSLRVRNPVHRCAPDDAVHAHRDKRPRPRPPLRGLSRRGSLPARRLDRSAADRFDPRAGAPAGIRRRVRARPAARRDQRSADWMWIAPFRVRTRHSPAPSPRRTRWRRLVGASRCSASSRSSRT